MDNDNLGLNVVEKDYREKASAATTKAAEAAWARAKIATSGLEKSDELATNITFYSGPKPVNNNAGYDREEDDLSPEIDTSLQRNNFLDDLLAS